MLGREATNKVARTQDLQNLRWAH